MSRSVYEYVAVIGIDGMGIFNRQADTPCIDKIFENGASTYGALSMNPTISAENWGAMLLGADPLVHGLTNSIVGRTLYTNKNLPSVFSRMRKAFPDAPLASFCNWNPINHGIVEHGENVVLETADNDEILCDKIVDYVENKPKFLFVQFDNVDGAGHGNGYGTKGHLEQISKADALTGRIFEAYEKAGIIDDTLFIVTADHGGIRNGHGGYTDEEKFVFLAARGKGVEKGEIGFAKTKDIAAIVLYALGLEVPEYCEKGFSSQIPDGIFPEISGTYRRTQSKPFIPENIPTPPIDGKGGLYSFFPAEKLKLAMFFDNSVEDATGKAKLTQHNLVKYYSEGVRGSFGEMGATGYVTADSVSFGKESFTLTAWLKIDRTLDEPPVICTNKNFFWKNRSEKGFALAIRGGGILFDFGNGEDHEDVMTPYPEEISDGWLHAAVTLDAEKKELRVYYNFKFIRAFAVDEKFLIDFDCGPFTVGNDSCGVYNNETYRLLFNIDDFFVFSGAFTEKDVKALAQYYSM